MDSANWNGPNPYIPDGFRQLPLSQRILVVGESHYGDEQQKYDPKITNNVIGERIAGQHHHFFGTVERILGSDPKDQCARADFWNRTGFLNYAPHLVARGSICQQHHYKGAAERLASVIKAELPRLVCFFSAGAWSRRPWGEYPWVSEAFGKEPEPFGSDEATVYRGLQQAVLMIRFNHPRALGAPIPVWQTWYKNNLERAAKLP